MSAEQQRRTDDDPEPACSRTNSDWEPESATGGLLAFHPPCRRCLTANGPSPRVATR
ncbi:hypothetical protein [Haloglomus litoreum]|uniref:hypothetical protein n=1 Tax=Haloglomus litoreum TaxID=3034026 RepID=UPI0023E84800|nr:hypothetical protein [Haloglomus sp. DT116]